MLDRLAQCAMERGLAWQPGNHDASPTAPTRWPGSLLALQKDLQRALRRCQDALFFSLAELEETRKDLQGIKEAMGLVLTLFQEAGLQEVAR